MLSTGNSATSLVTCGCGPLWPDLILFVTSPSDGPVGVQIRDPNIKSCTSHWPPTMTWVFSSHPPFAALQSLTIELSRLPLDSTYYLAGRQTDFHPVAVTESSRRLAGYHRLTTSGSLLLTNNYQPSENSKVRLSLYIISEKKHRPSSRPFRPITRKVSRPWD